MSAANHLRIGGTVEPGQVTIVEDEADGIEDDAEKMKILKTGYKFQGKVPRINMLQKSQPMNWFHTYAMRLLMAEKALDQINAKGLLDRTFKLYFRPGDPKYVIDDAIHERGNLYGEFMSFRKTMLCWRLVHFADKLPDIEVNLTALLWIKSRAKSDRMSDSAVK